MYMYTVGMSHINSSCQDLKFSVFKNLLVPEMLLIFKYIEILREREREREREIERERERLHC